MINRTEKSRVIGTDQAAALKGDLKHFLKPYFDFRLYVKFFNRSNGLHFYGNEHECTYRQLKHDHVPFVLLNKKKGYEGLINLVEHTWHSKINTGTIYRRDPLTKKFDHVCRRWYNKQWEFINDPLITDIDNIVLAYFFKEGRLQFTQEKIHNIDFKLEIQNSLNRPQTRNE